MRSENLFRWNWISSKWDFLFSYLQFFGCCHRSTSTLLAPSCPFLPKKNNIFSYESLKWPLNSSSISHLPKRRRAKSEKRDCEANICWLWTKTFSSFLCVSLLSCSAELWSWPNGSVWTEQHWAENDDIPPWLLINYAILSPSGCVIRQFFLLSNRESISVSVCSSRSQCQRETHQFRIDFVSVFAQWWDELLLYLS